MTPDELTVESFCERNRISAAQWDAAAISWNDLKNIGKDLANRTKELEGVAAFYAGYLQGCPAVHSVRWRVKDPEHLMEKIVRKRAEHSKKYANVSSASYLNLVTDLVGLRALHLFKLEWKEIHAFLSPSANHEQPVAYVRAGDSDELRRSYEKEGCRVEVHRAGYRSVHYVMSGSFLGHEVLTEVQVRTIFEEGWSEIDHRVRYPNFSDNELIRQFLATLNRIAGSADEMGSFVQQLAVAVDEFEQENQRARNSAEEHMTNMEVLLGQLREQQEKGEAQDRQLQQLATELEGLRTAGARHSEGLPGTPQAGISAAASRELAGYVATRGGSGGSAQVSGEALRKAEEQFRSMSEIAQELARGRDRVLSRKGAGKKGGTGNR